MTNAENEENTYARNKQRMCGIRNDSAKNQRGSMRHVPSIVVNVLVSVGGGGVPRATAGRTRCLLVSHRISELDPVLLMKSAEMYFPYIAWRIEHI